MKYHDYRPGRITPHKLPPKRPRVPWFCGSFTALLVLLAFLVGMTAGIVVTLRIVRTSDAPAFRAKVELAEEPRVVTKGDDSFSF